MSSFFLDNACDGLFIDRNLIFLEKSEYPLSYSVSCLSDIVQLPFWFKRIWNIPLFILDAKRNDRTFLIDLFAQLHYNISGHERLHVDGFRLVGGNVNADFLHHLDGVRMYRASIEPGTFYSYIISTIMFANASAI